MSTRTVHMGLSVRGALQNLYYLPHVDGTLVGCCADEETGRKLTSDEIFDALCDYLEAGKLLIPYGPCDLWDWKTGCPGHEIDEPKAS